MRILYSPVLIKYIENKIWEKYCIFSILNFKKSLCSRPLHFFYTYNVFNLLQCTYDHELVCSTFVEQLENRIRASITVLCIQNLFLLLYHESRQTMVMWWNEQMLLVNEPWTSEALINLWNIRKINLLSKSDIYLPLPYMRERWEKDSYLLNIEIQVRFKHLLNTLLILRNK